MKRIAIIIAMLFVDGLVLITLAVATVEVIKVLMNKYVYHVTWSHIDCVVEHVLTVFCCFIIYALLLYVRYKLSVKYIMLRNNVPQER